MIKVAALSSGRLVSSARFRVRQHIEPLRALGVDVREFVPAISQYTPLPGWPRQVRARYGLPYYALWQGIKLATRVPGVIGSRSCQVSWLQRELLPGYCTLEGLLQRPLVFDADDALWYASPWGRATVRAICRRADVVVAGNAYLADWFSAYARDVRVLPTAVDTERFRPGPPRSGERFVIGWIGSGDSLPCLEAIAAPLRRYLDDHPAAELLVVSDRYPAFQEGPGRRVRFLQWSAAAEAEAVQQMDVGLMPLPDNEWARGKCSYKMLQYMACGVPVVVSPVGMNAELLALGRIGLPAAYDDDWYEALASLQADPAAAAACGRNGRQVVAARFSRQVVAQELARLFKSLA